jgi:C1A family cysteine protease
MWNKMETLYGKLVLKDSNEIVGTGWLPYDYVLYNIASDFWSLLSMNWVDSGQFGI